MIKLGTYKTFSLVQSVILFITAWSIVDYGYTLEHILDKQNLFINNLLFSSSSDFWNVIAFWGYMAFIVGILEVVKAIKSKD